jgi:hypothetical protein
MRRRWFGFSGCHSWTASYSPHWSDFRSNCGKLFTGKGIRRNATTVSTRSPQIRHIAAFRLTCEIWRSYTSGMEYPGSPHDWRRTLLLWESQTEVALAFSTYPVGLGSIGYQPSRMKKARQKGTAGTVASRAAERRPAGPRKSFSRSARVGWVLPPAEWSKERSPQ